MIRPSEVRVFMSLATSSFFHVCATSSFSLVLHPHSIKFSAVIQGMPALYRRAESLFDHAVANRKGSQLVSLIFQATRQAPIYFTFLRCRILRVGWSEITI